MTTEDESRRFAKEKLKKLRSILSGMGKALLAYSGGVDSTFLLKVASEELGGNLTAVTASSPIYIAEEYKEALAFAHSVGVEHVTLESKELENPRFCKNPPDRCYFCKKELFSQLFKLAGERGTEFVLDASNADDLRDYRPGRTAAEELGVKSPLVETGLGKEEIRELSRQLGVPAWDKPAMACLASRFPYGEEITEEKLERVAVAERFLRSLGLRQVRVRSHGDLARIEVAPSKLNVLVDPEVRKQAAGKLKEAGFTYVALDIEGYRTGSLNEELRRE